MVGSGLLAAAFVDWSWIGVNGRLILDDASQHVELASIAVASGLLVSVPLALFSWHRQAMRTVIVWCAGLLYTIPSLALFVLIQPVTGYYSLLTSEVALTGYTLLILVRNLLTGLDQIDPEVYEAAIASGHTRRGALVRVYLPIALPSLYGGLRVATVTVVGLVTITAFVGWGGLGQMIITGLSENFYTPILVGLVGSILLAAIGDAVFVGLERATVRWHRVRG